MVVGRSSDETNAVAIMVLFILERFIIIILFGLSCNSIDQSLIL